MHAVTVWVLLVTSLRGEITQNPAELNRALYRSDYTSQTACLTAKSVADDINRRVYPKAQVQTVCKAINVAAP